MAQYSLKDALQEFLRGSRIKGDIRALQIEEIWESMMGKTVARYTDKIRILGDKLFIHTTMAPLRNELIYQREKIRQKVNEALGENAINEVVIQ